METINVPREFLELLRVIVCDYNDVACGVPRCPNTRYTIDNVPQDKMCATHSIAKSALERLDKLLGMDKLLEAINETKTP